MKTTRKPIYKHSVTLERTRGVCIRNCVIKCVIKEERARVELGYLRSPPALSAGPHMENQAFRSPGH